MTTKDKVKLAISKKLNKVFIHKSGVGNRADPTAWDSWTLQYRKIAVKVSAVWEPSLRVYYRARIVLFVSSAIHKRLYPAVKLLWLLLEFEQWEDHLEMHGEVDARLYFCPDLDTVEAFDYPPGLALDRAAMREEQRAEDAATCQDCGYYHEYCRCDSYCPTCGDAWAVHNGDGSCVNDQEDPSDAHG